MFLNTFLIDVYALKMRKMNLHLTQHQLKSNQIPQHPKTDKHVEWFEQFEHFTVPAKKSEKISNIKFRHLILEY